MAGTYYSRGSLARPSALSTWHHDKHIHVFSCPVVPAYSKTTPIGPSNSCPVQPINNRFPLPILTVAARSATCSTSGRRRREAGNGNVRRSTIGMCLTETLDEMVQNGTLSPELAIQVLLQFDKWMTEAVESQVKSKVSIKGHLHTYRFCDNVWTFILQDVTFKSDECQETVGRVKIVVCDLKLLTQ